MKLQIYIDTSVVGGCFDEEFSVHSNLIFEEFQTGNKTALISDLLLEELSFAPEHVRLKVEDIPTEHKTSIFLNEVILDLADLYIEEKALPVSSIADARHIATATYYRADVLISWNFKHIVNYNRIRYINSINLKTGYPLLEIRSPREIVEND